MSRDSNVDYIHDLIFFSNFYFKNAKVKVPGLNSYLSL